MYLTFDEYQAMGGELKSPKFVQAEFAARSKINNMTFNRITEVTESVKMCVFGLIERGYIGALNGEEITSEGNDGFSRSYASKDGKAEAFIRESLSDIPNLFYLGV